MVRFLQENGVDPATNAVRVLIRRMRSSTSGEKDTAATDAASAAHTGRNAFLRQTSFVSPPSAIYLNRTVVSTPAGDLSLEDVFNEVKPEGQKKISVTRELPMALTIMGLYWSPQLHRAALADSGCDVYHLEAALEQLADDVYGDDDVDAQVTSDVDDLVGPTRPRSTSERTVPALSLSAPDQRSRSSSVTRKSPALSARSDAGPLLPSPLGLSSPAATSSQLVASPAAAAAAPEPAVAALPELNTLSAAEHLSGARSASSTLSAGVDVGYVSTASSHLSSVSSPTLRPAVSHVDDDTKGGSRSNSASSAALAPHDAVGPLHNLATGRSIVSNDSANSPLGTDRSASSDASQVLSPNRQPPGPPPRERRPTRPPVTADMSPLHGAVRASRSSSSSTQNLLPPRSGSAHSVLPPKSPGTSPRSLDKSPRPLQSAISSPALLETIQCAPPAPVASESAEISASSGVVEVAAAAGTVAVAGPAAPATPLVDVTTTAAAPDRRMDFTTFCTTVAMLQVCGRGVGFTAFAACFFTQFSLHSPGCWSVQTLGRESAARQREG
jgi:hypothetical protein